LLLARLRGEFRRIEFALFSFLCGSAALSLLIFLLGTVHLVSRGVLQVLAFALIAAALWFHRGRDGESLEPLPQPWLTLFGLGFAGYGILYFVHALAPEASPDGVAYHLEIVGHYVRAHGLVPITTNMYASLSQGLEMLFLTAYTFGRHSAAAMVHFSFLLALPLLLVSYGRRFGFPAAGAFAGLVAFTCPLMGIDGISAYNDVALAATAFGTFYLLELWDRSRNRGLLLLAGLLAGFCYALKYTGGFVIPAAMAFVLWRQVRSGQGWLKGPLTVAVCAAAQVAPWMIKNWVWVKNPLAPFYNSWFPNPFIYVSFEHIYRTIMARIPDGSSRIAGLWDALISGRESQGLIGPLFALAPLALLALRQKEARRLLAAALVLLPGYMGNFGGRFLLPLVPFVAMAMALGMSRFRKPLCVLAVLQMIISLPGVVPLYAHPYAWRLEWPPVSAALRLKPEADFLASRLASYPAARRLDDVLPGTQTIYAGDPPAQAYTRHRILASYMSAFNQRLSEMLSAATVPPESVLAEWQYRFPSRAVRRIRVVVAKPGSDSQWCATEIRAWGLGKELERQSAWKLSARPNPWDVQLAFDNSYVTRWCTREPVSAGMHVEIDFGAPVTLDAVTIEAAMDETATLRIEGADEHGGWALLSDKTQPAPLKKVTGLRRAAMAEFKARGVPYLLVKDTADYAEDFWRNKPYWGVTEVFEAAGYRLYRID
ncbi:MAG: discoidin domain-containing protein, partial [Bryobacteraceae bacterium]